VDELSKATGDVYKNVGALLIKVDDKDGIKDELEESIETLEIRVNGLDRQAKSLQEKYQTLQETINKALGNISPQEDR